MGTILAAVDASAAAGPVLATARMLGRQLGLAPVVLHSDQDGSTAAVHALSRHAGLALQQATGPPAKVILAALDDPQTMLAVLGARRLPGGQPPVGPTTLAVVCGTAKPVVVVPADLPVAAWGRPGSVVVPLDGSVATSRAVGPMVAWLAGHGLGVVVVHVFTPTTAPGCWDHAGHEHAAWSREFLQRHLPTPAARLEVRAGRPASQVLAVAAAEHAGLVVLAWAQDLSGDRALLIREVLAGAQLPVWLLPAAPPPAARLPRSPAPLLTHSPSMAG